MNKKYDFESVVDRRGLDAVKWDVIPIPGATVKEGFSHIPMWVADMDFPTAPSVLAAIQARLMASQSFGYYNLEGTGYHDAVMKWQKERNNVDIGNKDYISYENSVLGGVANIINSYTEVGDPILLHSPTYIGFTNTVNSAKRKIILSEMKKDAEGTYRIDYEDCEKKIVENNIKVAVFCSPHNPTGRVWDKEEIAEFVDVCVKHNVKIASDEIWSDFIMGDKKHIATQSVSEAARQNVAAFYAPSKTFNLAGLVGAYSIIYNDEMREQCRTRAGMTHYNLPNILSAYALVGGYTGGTEYVEELIKVIKKNQEHAYEVIQTWGGLVETQKPQGTYVMFLDFTKYCEARGKTLDQVLERCVSVGVICQDGRPFHGPCHSRFNFACPNASVVEAFARLDKYLIKEEW